MKIVKTQYFCDKCGKEVEFLKMTPRIRYSAMCGGLILEKTGIELCVDCYRKAIKLYNEAVGYHGDE